MTSTESPTFQIAIYIAGDRQQAKQVCREFCATGFCVSIEAVDFIYTGGEETGLRVNLFNYPRFPSEPEALWAKAVDLADQLRARLFQHSYSIVATDRTLWSSLRT